MNITKQDIRNSLIEESISELGKEFNIEKQKKFLERRLKRIIDTFTYQKTRRIALSGIPEIEKSEPFLSGKNLFQIIKDYLTKEQKMEGVSEEEIKDFILTGEASFLVNMSATHKNIIINTSKFYLGYAIAYKVKWEVINSLYGEEVW